MQTYGYSQFGGFLDLPGVKQAYEFVQKHLTLWSQLPGRFQAAATKAHNLATLAKAQNKPQLATTVGGVVTDVTNLQNEWARINEKLSGVLRDLKAAGFGIIPLVLAGSLIAAVATMVTIFKKIEYDERVLADVEKGLLPASVLAPPAGGGFGTEIGKSVGGVVQLALFAALGFGAYKALSKRRAA